MVEQVLEMFPSVGRLTHMIDTTMLRPEATESEYVYFLREAADARFRSAFVPLYYLPMARQELEGSGVALGAPIGFPFGHVSTDCKKAEAVFALQQGAGELDMVVNISALRSKRFDRVREDIAAVVGLARRYDAGKGEGHVVVKVILETCYLNREDMRRGALLAKEAGADFVKTSTGFGTATSPGFGTATSPGLGTGTSPGLGTGTSPGLGTGTSPGLGTGGADAGDVAFLREVVGPGFGVKASGGIRDLASVMEMVRAGASRIGTSSAYNILQEYLRILPWNRT